MDTAYILPGAGHAGNANPATQEQQPVVGGMPAGQVHALPHASWQQPWQQRPRGQAFPQVAYMPHGQLPPPIPPGMAADGAATGGYGHGAASVVQMTPSGTNVPVPASDVGSTAPIMPDLEFAAPQHASQPTTWQPEQSPGASQQQAMDMAVLTATMQSMSSTLQQLLEDNRRLAEELRALKTERATHVDRQETNRPKPSAEGEPQVKRPLIGSFDREAAERAKEFSMPNSDDQWDLKDIDKKDVVPPSKFKGDANQWRHWYMKFSSFLHRRDPRWTRLLEEVRKHSQNPLNPEDEDSIFKNVDVNSTILREKFKGQLYEYLESYTEGLVHGMVTAGGPQGALEVFRGLCDDGFSTRDRHLRREYRSVTHPRQATFETLKKAIMDWETQLAQYQAAAGTEMSEKERIICLEDLCPDLLQQHLDSKESLKTYGQYKTAINDYLSNRARWLTGKARLNWLGLPEGGEPEPAGDEDAEEQWMAHISGEINALVRNKFKGKGFGKNGGKSQNNTTGKASGAPGGAADVDMKDAPRDHSNKKCYDCGETGHIGADCPVRKARVAAGGPERVDKPPKGGGRGGKGGKAQGWPSKAQWGGFYPGPTQAQWSQWFPQAPKGGVAALQDQPQGVLQALFSGPQQLSLKSVVPAKKKSFETPNPFDALKTEEPDELPVKNMASIEEFIRPSRRALKRTKRLCTPAGCCEGQCGHADAGQATGGEVQPVREEPPLRREAGYDPARSLKKSGTEARSQRRRENFHAAQELLNSLNASDELDTRRGAYTGNTRERVEPRELPAAASQAHRDDEVAGVSDWPSIVGARKLTREQGLGNPLRKESQNSRTPAHRDVEKNKGKHDNHLTGDMNSEQIRQRKTSQKDNVPFESKLTTVNETKLPGTKPDERAAAGRRPDEGSGSIGVSTDAEAPRSTPGMFSATPGTFCKPSAEDAEYEKFMKSIGQGATQAPSDPAALIENSINQFMEFANLKMADAKQNPEKLKGTLNLLNKVIRTGNLMPVTKKGEVNTTAGMFEVLSCIVDSGATVPVMHPTTGECYQLEESEASKEGVLYELANSDTLPNLGEKRMAVLTAEGTLRGYGSQCADVSKPLQAVRSLVRSKHAVCFGLGDNDDEHLIINKVTGEINRMRDDGINYLQDLLIIPPDKVDTVAGELMKLSQQGTEDGQGFGRPGP